MVNPVVFQIGNVSVRWYGILLVIGAILWIYVFLKLRSEKGIRCLGLHFLDDYRITDWGKIIPCFCL